MVGGTGLTGLGAFIVYYAFQKRNKPNTGRLTMFVSSFLGSVIMTMGLLRLAGIHDLQNVQLQEQKQPQLASKNDSELLRD